jgi:ATP-dependent Clp protease ATP-binding subunit ClpC
VFEWFTQSARQVVVFAQEEARTLRHSHIGSEALLLGLLREQHGVAANALAFLGVSLEQARLAVTRYVASGDEGIEGFMPFTPRAKQILHQASDEAAALNNKYVGTEHILLALTTIDESVAKNVLRDFDLDATTIRDRVIQQVADFPSDPRRREPSPTRWRRSRGAEAGPALEDGRIETTIGDLLITLSRADRLRPVLPELAAGEARIRAALERLGPDEPPESANGA